MEDIAVPVLDGGDGWKINATIEMSGFRVSTGVIQLDPAAVFIEVPMSVIRRLLVVMRMQSAEVTLDDLGALRMPCDETDRITISQEFQLVIDNASLAVQPSTHVGSPRGGGMCVTQFRLNQRKDEWRISPLLIVGMRPVFLHGADRTITFRRGNLLGLPTIPAVPEMDIPLFSAHTVTTSPGGDSTLAFAPGLELHGFLSLRGP